MTNQCGNLWRTLISVNGYNYRYKHNEFPVTETIHNLLREFLWPCVCEKKNTAHVAHGQKKTLKTKEIIHATSVILFTKITKLTWSVFTIYLLSFNIHYNYIVMSEKLQNGSQNVRMFNVSLDSRQRPRKQIIRFRSLFFKSPHALTWSCQFSDGQHNGSQIPLK